MVVISDDDFVRPFQTTFGLTSDGFAENATIAKMPELAAPAGVTIPSVPVGEIRYLTPALLIAACAGLASRRQQGTRDRDLPAACRSEG